MKTCTPMFTAVLLTVAKKLPKCLLTDEVIGIYIQKKYFNKKGRNSI